MDPLKRHPHQSSQRLLLKLLPFHPMTTILLHYLKGHPATYDDEHIENQIDPHYNASIHPYLQEHKHYIPNDDDL